MKSFLVWGVIASVVVVAAACDGTASPTDGGGRGLGGGLDPSILRDCRAAGGLSLGRCVDAAGVPCTGGEATAAAFFDPLPEGGLVAPVVGPQGSAMFAFAVRATDIDPGDAASVFSADNPILEIDLLDGADVEVLAAYRGRSGFRPVEGSPGTFDHAQAFVIVDHAISTLRGERLRIDALLTDRAGERRCGALSFLASAE